MKKIILATSIICAALTGCADKSPQQSCDKSLKVECYARSSTGSNVPVKEFGMYIMNGENSYEGVTNPVHVTYNTNWEFREIWLNEQASIYAFSPYQSTSDITAINLSLQQQTDYLATFSALNADKSNNRVHIVLDHLLSKIKIRIAATENLTFTIPDIETSATYNLVNNSIIASNKGTLTSKGAEILIFPVGEKSLTMNISYNGKSYKYVAPTKSYESGKEYTYNLKISDSKELIIDGEVEVNPWEVGGNYDGTVRE